jgi:hypothetical protein
MIALHEAAISELTRQVCADAESRFNAKIGIKMLVRIQGRSEA